MKNRIKNFLSTAFLIPTFVVSSLAMDAQKNEYSSSWTHTRDILSVIHPYIASQDLESFSAVCHCWHSFSQCFVRQLKGYNLINMLNNRPLEEALSLLTFYIPRDLHAADVLYEASLLYDSQANPDIADKDRLFLWVGKSTQWTEKGGLVPAFFCPKKGKLVLTSFLEEIPLILDEAQANEIKRRYLLYYPYNLCVTLASLLKQKNKGAYERYNNIRSLLRFKDDQLPVWSPGDVTRIEVTTNEYNQKIISRNVIEDYTETFKILEAVQSLCVGEWCKAAYLKDESRMRAIFEHYFKVKHSMGCQQNRFPPHLMHFIANYDERMIDLLQKSFGGVSKSGFPTISREDFLSFVKAQEFFKKDPFNNEIVTNSQISLQSDHMLSFLLSHMDKTLKFCEHAAKKEVFYILEVLPKVYIEGILENIYERNERFEKYYTNNPLSVDFSLKNTVLNKHAAFYKNAEYLIERYIVLMTDEYRKRDKDPIDDFYMVYVYKMPVLASVQAAKIILEPEIKTLYCEQALARYEEYLHLFKGTNKEDELDGIPVQLSKWMAESSSVVSKKVEYYLQAISYYNTKYVNFNIYKNLAEIHENIIEWSLDEQQKIQNCEKAIELYDKSFKEITKWTEKEEKLEVYKNSIAVRETLAKIISDPVRQIKLLSEISELSDQMRKVKIS